MATNWTKSTNGANERHRRGRVVRAARGCSRRDRGNDQGRERLRLVVRTDRRTVAGRDAQTQADVRQRRRQRTVRAWGRVCLIGMHANVGAGCHGSMRALWVSPATRRGGPASTPSPNLPEFLGVVGRGRVSRHASEPAPYRVRLDRPNRVRRQPKITPQFPLPGQRGRDVAVGLLSRTRTRGFRCGTDS